MKAKFKMSTRIMLVLLVLTAAGISMAGSVGAAVQSDPAQKVPLVSSSKPVHGNIHYDKATGRCSNGATALVNQDEYKALTEGWALAVGCKAPQKSAIPSKAGYPDTFGKFHTSGSADVLVRLNADGSIESARAICATDKDFGKAAEDTAKAIHYLPASCNGVGTRDAFRLPFSYDR